MWGGEPMLITEQIEKRIVELEAEREVHMARANATAGAIFELRRWLAESQKPPEQAEQPQRGPDLPTTITEAKAE